MKIITLTLSLLFFCNTILSQDQSLTEKVNSLKTKISISQKGEKLKLLDSLTRLVEFNEDYDYTTLANETINLGIELDSIHEATRMAADYIFYQINVLNKPQKGLNLYEQYIKKIPRLDEFSISANLHLYGGDGHRALGDYDKSIEKYQQSLAISRKIGNQDRTAIALYRSGLSKGAIGDFAAASKEISESYTIYTSIKDTVNMINTKNGLSILIYKR